MALAVRGRGAPDEAVGTEGAVSSADPPAVVVLRRGRDEPADAELVGRAAAGEGWAEEALYRRHAARIHAVTLRLLGRRLDAEDVVQDAFVTAFARLGELREPARFGPWLLTIAVRLVYRVLRRRRLRRLLGLDRDDGHEVALVPASTASAEDRAMLREVEHALSRLAAKDRVPWVLHHVEGCTLEEVAAACGCSLATAKRRIAVAHAVVARRVGLPEVQP